MESKRSFMILYGSTIFMTIRERTQKFFYQLDGYKAHKYKITELIKVAEIARSTYYYYVKMFDKPDKYADVKIEVLRIFRDENKCRRGYRTATLKLRKTCIINHKTV